MFMLIYFDYFLIFRKCQLEKRHKTLLRLNLIRTDTDQIYFSASVSMEEQVYDRCGHAHTSIRARCKSATQKPTIGVPTQLCS